MARKTALEEAILLRYVLRSLSVAIKGQTNLYGDNQGMLQSRSMIDLEHKKRHLAIVYHKMRECVATGIINPVKILTDHNISDFLTELLEWSPHHYHAGAFFSRWKVGSGVDMTAVQL